MEIKRDAMKAVMPNLSTENAPGPVVKSIYLSYQSIYATKGRSN